MPADSINRNKPRKQMKRRIARILCEIRPRTKRYFHPNVGREGASGVWERMNSRIWSIWLRVVDLLMEFAFSRSLSFRSSVGLQPTPRHPGELSLWSCRFTWLRDIGVDAESPHQFRASSPASESANLIPCNNGPVAQTDRATVS